MGLSTNLKLDIYHLDLFLDKDRGLFLHDTLIISDVHFGKVNHFRKAGIALPAQAIEANFNRLKNLILRYDPKQVVFLGDFFHSDLNNEWRLVESFLKNPDFRCNWILIEGNHDILDPKFYKDSGLELMPFLALGKFLLTHEPMEQVPENLINIHGHIHPGIRLKGAGRQSVTVPCFHLSKQHLCMPAFGELTGLAIQNTRKNDRVIAVIEEGVFEVSAL